MGRRAFVAEDLWLAIAIVTLPAAGLAGLAGIPGLAEAIVILGWLCLTPVFLFWGDLVAGWVFGPEEEEGNLAATEMLKRRYAAGDIDEAEFERRLDGLLASEHRERERDL